MTRIFLIGYMGSGKTTLGRALAAALDLQFIDLDHYIEQRYRKTIAQLFAESGEEGFREIERRILHEVGEFENVIISTGGGICDNAPALELLSQFGTFIFLKTPEEVSANRIINKAEQLSDGTWKNLPAYISNQNPKSEKEVRQIFHTFYVARVEIYSKIADKTIELKSDSKENNLKLIMENL
jgi:shikimate kinase